MKNKKIIKENAITLVALVITVIILIILAGVSLNLALGQNGIFVKSKEAVDKYKDEAQKEQNTLENIYVDILAETGGGEEKQDYSQLKIGDYVNYPVYYDNVATWIDKSTGQEDNYPKEEYANKWRIISINKNNNEVQLVSAGVPLNYYHYDNTSISITALTTNFFNTNIKCSKGIEVVPEQYQFHQSGFKESDNVGYVEEMEDVKRLFSNEYTKITKEIPNVRSLNFEDFSGIWDEELINEGTGYYLDDKYKDLGDLLVIPSIRYNQNDFSYVWLAYAERSDFLWEAFYNNYINTQSKDNVLGVRLVVTLESNIKFTKASTDTNETTTWDISK